MKIDAAKKALCNASDTKRGREIQRIIREETAQKCAVKYADCDLVAGCDVSYRRDGISKAAVVVYSRIKKKFVEEVTAEVATEFPYIPTFLSFREAPALLVAFEKLKSKPQVFIFDGQGLAHPHHAGLATHMGVVLEKPSVGCAKSHLYGIYEEPPNVKGAYTFIKEKDGELLGVCLRTKVFVKPLFLSIGWGVDISFIMDAVWETLTRYRIPDVMRRADKLSKDRPLNWREND